MISLMSPVGGDSAAVDESKWILLILTMLLFFFPICPLFHPIPMTHTTPSFPSSVFLPGSQCHAPGPRPASPQPIRLTRPELRQTLTADIVLKKPVETEWAIISFALILHSNNFYFASFDASPSPNCFFIHRKEPFFFLLRILTGVHCQDLTYLTFSSIVLAEIIGHYSKLLWLKHHNYYIVIIWTSA